MNVLFVATSFKPALGGVEELTHQLALGLHRAGDRVAVIAQEQPNAAPFDISCPYTVHRVDLDTNRGFLPRLLHRLRVIRGAAASCQADVICSNQFNRTSLATLVASRIDKRRYCLYVHGLDINKKLGWLGGIKRSFTLWSADRVACNSSYTRRVAIRRGARSRRVVGVPPGVTLASPERIGSLRHRAVQPPQPTDRKSMRVLSLGRLIERKGYDTSLLALKAVTREFPDIQYVLAGDGPERRPLEALADRLGIAANVTFAGSVSESEKLELLRQADVFVMINRELPNGDVEGFGIVFLEAGLEARPVVGGASGGVPDAVEDGTTGILVDPNDAGAVAQAILMLLRDRSLAQRMGEVGRARVRREFSWQSSARKFRRHLAAATDSDTRRL